MGMAVLVLLVVHTAATGRLVHLTACMAAMDTMIYIPFLLQGAMPVSMSTLSVFNIALYGAFCFAFLRELRAEGAPARSKLDNKNKKETPMEKPVLYIVIPCYNEQEVLPVTSGMFLEKVKGLAAAGKISEESRVMFVNDGSKDDTWGIIRQLACARTSIFWACAFLATAATRMPCWLG